MVNALALLGDPVTSKVVMRHAQQPHNIDEC